MLPVLRQGELRASVGSSASFSRASLQGGGEAGRLSGIITVKWTDGSSLTMVNETRIRERYDPVLIEERTGNKTRTGSVFVSYERSYSPRGLGQVQV